MRILMCMYKWTVHIQIHKSFMVQEQKKKHLKLIVCVEVEPSILLLIYEYFLRI